MNIIHHETCEHIVLSKEEWDEYDKQTGGFDRYVTLPPQSNISVGDKALVTLPPQPTFSENKKRIGTLPPRG